MEKKGESAIWEHLSAIYKEMVRYTSRLWEKSMMSESLSEEAMKRYSRAKQEDRRMKEWSAIQSRNNLKNYLCWLLLRSSTEGDWSDDWW